MDQRIVTLAKNIVNYSCNLQKGEKILIQTFGTDSAPLVRQIIKEVYAVEGIPFTSTRLNTLDREILMGASEEQMQVWAKADATLMSDMDAYVGIREGENPYEHTDVPQDKMALYQKIYQQEVHTKIRVAKTKWVVMNYPNYAMAHAQGQSLEATEEFYYKVCNLDYAKLSKAMDAFVDVLKKTDKVRIVGPGTDLTCSIKNMPPIKCDGQMNIPDGEVFLAPVKNSVNGRISYNTPSRYQGFVFEDVVFDFVDGKIVNATANNTDFLNKILDTDEGARYIGEFAFGVNPFITKPMLNTLFDEKIAGSIHFTPGNAYDWSCNGNKSAIHWD
ncbi:MAG: aminopeptidase, partial [Defluviitaleaceae bacterium]|nr:aminopeptidase [Defluviitaleaceae bacterium]